jgi:DNA-binding LytR/AlgR family response regulator
MKAKLLTCLIIEDEPLAQELIVKYIKRVPFLVLVDTCEDAIDGLEKIKNHRPDVVFLDINLPEMTGMELLTVLGVQKTAIIITTGYPDFAVESYSFNVTDYLLKPISFEKFMRSITRVQEKIDTGVNIGKTSQDLQTINSERNNSESSNFDNDYIYLNVGKKKVRVLLDDIVYAEGMKDYIKVYTNDSHYVIHHTMKKMEELLPKNKFMRINRSFIINMQSIRSIEGNRIELVSQDTLDIGVTYRELVLKKLGI